jgi:outer membrane protein
MSFVAIRRLAVSAGIAAVGVAGGPGQGPAQEPPPAEAATGPRATRELTLGEALDIAALGNPAYRRELNQLELGGPQRQQVIGDFLPSVDLSLGTAQGFVRQAVGTDDFGRPVPNPDVRTTYQSSSNQALSFNWTLFDGLRRFQALKEQDAQVRAWSGAAEARLATLTADVERAFFEAQLRREHVIMEEDLLRVRQRVLEATERLFALADKSRADVLGARVEVQLQEKALEDARSEYRKQLLALRRHLGDPSIGEFQLAEAPLTVFDPASLDVEALVGQAVEGNPGVRRDEADVALQRAVARGERGTRWPTVTLSGDVARTEWGLDQSALFDLSPGTQSAGGLRLALSWDLFDNFNRQYNVAAADIAHRNAQETLRDSRLQVEQDVRTGFIALETAFINLETLESAQELAQERLRLAGEEYLLAGRTFEELQDAVSSAAEASRDVVQARFDFVSSRIDLEQGIGARIVTDAAQPNGGR